MDEFCDISCSGKPQGKARAKTVRNKHTGNTMSYTPETDLLYENYIKDRFLNKCNGMFLEQGKPVTLRIVARFLPPKSTSKKRTALMRWMERNFRLRSRILIIS